ncbi:unnamed protein product, partial [Ascophyllum nodosum]
NRVSNGVGQVIAPQHCWILEESFSHGLSRDITCIVTVYADGGTFTVPPGPQRTPSREEMVLDWFFQTTLALKHIHDRKILHR